MSPRLEEFWPARGYKRILLVSCLIAFAVSIWVFVELADDPENADTLAWENRLLLAMRDPADPSRGIGPWWLPEAARDITALGSAVVLTLIAASIVGFLVLRSRLRTAALLTVATLGGYLLSSTLKEFFARGRPTIVPHLMEEISMSFPSGHSMVGSAFYLTIGVILAQTVARRLEKVYCIVIALLLSLLIGGSRVYLGVHYPTDVIGGWAAGSAWALMCWGAAWWLQHRGALRTPEEAAHADDAAAPES
jgi:undecaprenyl-diphosphatase